MSTALSEPKLTTTVGYYNGNKWPIHLVISELNVTLHLKPGEYILDTTARKINDPFFDKYTRPLQLSKEVSKNGQVPLLAVPKVTPQSERPRPAHSVTAVTKFTADRKPIMPVPQALPPQLDVNTPTHKGMSVEEARRLGFIGKPREVPEDYGVTDTSGRPVDVHAAPPIKYAMESQPRIRQAPQLPEGLLKVDKEVDPSSIGTRQSLVQSMSKAAQQAPAAENPTGFMNQSSPIVAPNGQPAAEAIQEAEAEEPLPAPNIFNQDQVAPQVPKGVPDLNAIARQNATKASAPKNTKPFVCLVDGSTFRYRSQLESYAKRKHPGRVAEILAPYPEEAK